MRSVSKFVINVEWSPWGMRAAADALREFGVWAQQKQNELLSRLANIGLEEASIHFAYVRPFYNNGHYRFDAELSVEQIDNGYVIRASGEDVCFIEFGAGVTYGEGYPGDRPEGVVGIGEYGNKHGAEPKGWWFPVDDSWERTFGNPPAAGMFAAEQKVRQQVYNIAKEVFGG